METIRLDEVVRMVEEINETCVKDISPFKLKVVLFFAQIEYYTLYGVKLFDNEIYCYYNDLTIAGLDDVCVVWVAKEYPLIYEMLFDFVHDLEDESEEDLLPLLYQSKAFLKANLARGHRLTKKVLVEYHDMDRFYENISQSSRNNNVDEVMLHYQFVDEIIDDLEIFN